MTCGDDPNIDLAQIIRLARQDEALVRHLLRCDETFRAICEDHALARHARKRLMDEVNVAGTRATMDEYDRLITELEDEIKRALKNAG